MGKRSSKIKASSEIEEVISEIIRQRDSGTPLDESAVSEKYPHLMPELGQRLRMLRMIEAAGEYAEAHPDTTMQTETDHETADLDEDIEYLRGALEGYELLERVHHGGQGVVYKAVQQSTSRIVAVKVLLHGPLATERQRYRFAREVEISSRMRHPNIVTLYDSGIVRGRPYVAMEYIEGLPFDDYVLLNDLAVRGRVELFMVICRAVACAHQNGIIHRDLKPSNILVDSEGVPHILDFGLAKDLYTPDDQDEGALVSMPGQMLGTLPYLSPEQAGFGGQVDLRADIYSMGVMLHELLTGTFPYPVTGDREAVRLNILSCEPAPLRKALESEDADERVNRREIDDDLEAIVLKTLDKEPARRYQSADAMAADLDRWLKHDAVEAKADRRFYVLKKTIRKYRVHAAITAGFLVLLVAGLVGVFVAWQKAEHVATTAQKALSIVAMHRTGASFRDEGRIDDAIDILKKASEIGETVVSSDPTLRRFRFAALYDLAELHLEYRTAEEANRYSEEAVALAEEYILDDPENLELQRLLAHSFLLRSTLATANGELAEAETHAATAADVAEKIIMADPDHPTFRRLLAVAVCQQGRCLQDLKSFQESRECYEKARAIYERLVQDYPRTADYGIELCRTEARLAVWHLHHKKVENNQAASTLLEKAESRLVALQRDGLARGREFDVRSIMDVIQSNKGLIERRANQQAQTP
jgi:tRNA A-37 threonylcarbamoyl transferase component Bud32/tetratricopeptide (TPR) repeat protein